MAKVALPRHMRAKKTTKGPAFYWEMPTWARGAVRGGKTCPVVNTPLGSDLGAAIEKAEHLNETLDQWRRVDTTVGPAPGTVDAIFAWYRNQHKFTKNKAKTRADYAKIMNAVSSLPMRRGTFGQRQAAKVGPEVADQIYDIFAKRGRRQAYYVVQVCRAVWNWAARYHKTTGIPKGENPFEKMAVSYAAAEGNRHTSRAEYNAYRAKARELGFQSMATAAALCFELTQRVWDAFAIPDPKEGDRPASTPSTDRGIRWEDYQPGSLITVRQQKTGRRLRIPLVEVLDDGERVPLYPELEEELALSHRAGATGVIVVEERTGLPYHHRRMSTVHRQICNAAGLPKNMTFTGFRHGGTTELGDAGEVDVRPLSGHAKLDTTAIYNKLTEEKALRIARRRREHLDRITKSEESEDA